MKPVIAALKGKTGERIPFWMMRQAGRYLPEYRELRAEHGSFLDLVYTPQAAADVTLQPLRRFGVDAAILFSDILVVPHALGQGVTFTEGHGPKLEPIRSAADIGRLDPVRMDGCLSSVYETVSLVRGKLQSEGMNEAALIGFAGSPWTVACYMVEGGGSKDFLQTKLWAYREPDNFSALLGLVEEATIQYLLGQIKAGAEVIQLFDSWAGILDASQFARWVIEPTRRICSALHDAYPGVPVIGFPRGAGYSVLKYVQETGVDAVALDSQVPVRWAANVLQPIRPVQGNLDPACLLAGGDALVLELENILAHLSRGPFVFNLGHGIQKDTPLGHVEQLVEVVRSWKA